MYQPPSHDKKMAGQIVIRTQAIIPQFCSVNFCTFTTPDGQSLRSRLELIFPQKSGSSNSAMNLYLTFTTFTKTPRLLFSHSLNRLHWSYPATNINE